MATALTESYTPATYKAEAFQSLYELEDSAEKFAQLAGFNHLKTVLRQVVHPT